MYKLLMVIGLLTFSISSFSQKVKIKDEIATVDGTPTLKVVTASAFDNTITISGLSSTQDEIFATYLDYEDPNKVSASNPEGKVRWIELNFLTSGVKCEISSQGKKGLVKFIVNNKLYVDGVLNEDNVNVVVQKYGMRFSENRPNAGVTVIINN